MDDLPPAYDKFSLPGEIPDGYGVPSEDWQARGLAHPAGRGWEPDRPPSVAELDARFAQWGAGLRTPPGRGSQAGSHKGRWAGDPPAPPAPAEDALLAGGAAPGPGQVFTPALQVRFLDSLATSGNVRVSAARVGISHETAYRQRRRCARFAAMWQAALHHARHRVAAVIGDRALDGTVEEVWFRGELVGHRRRYDGRLLLAHIARLDRLAEEGGGAAAHAEWFDAGLARLAGHPEPEGFDEAQGLWDEGTAAADDDEDGAAGAPPPPPPTRREWTAWYRGQALEEAARADADRVRAEAGEEAEALYDAWEAGVRARVDAILAGSGPGVEVSAGAGAGSSDGADPAGVEARIEYKSLARGRARGCSPDTVTGVNTPCGAGSAAAAFSASAGARLPRYRRAAPRPRARRG
jgi:hypothetical protein